MNRTSILLISILLLYGCDNQAEIQKEKDKLAKMRKKQRQYTKFAKKLGVNRVSDLKKNEIKLKVDQILNMNK